MSRNVLFLCLFYDETEILVDKLIAKAVHPGLDSKGNDVEGESRKQQLWLQLSTNF